MHALPWSQWYGIAVGCIAALVLLRGVMFALFAIKVPQRGEAPGVKAGVVELDSLVMPRTLVLTDCNVLLLYTHNGFPLTD